MLQTSWPAIEALELAGFLLLCSFGAVFDPQIKRLRFLKMLDMKIRGKGNKAIARAFNLSEKTVDRTLTWGKRADLITEEEDHILEKMLPLSRLALEKALQGDDVELAAKIGLEMYKGSGVLSKNKAKSAPGQADPQAELAKHIAWKRAKAQELAETFDGELVQRQIAPPAPEIKELTGE